MQSFDRIAKHSAWNTAPILYVSCVFPKAFMIRRGKTPGSAIPASKNWNRKVQNRVLLLSPRLPSGDLPHRPFLDDRPEMAILHLEKVLKFPEEMLEIMKEHPVKHRVLRMTLAVYPCHHSYFRDLTGSAVAALMACQLIARKDTRRVRTPGIRKTIGPSFVW